MFDLENKRVFITGVGGGIGHALLEGFLAAGATVLGTFRSANPQMDDLLARYKCFIPISCDLSDIKAVENLAGRAAELLGGPAEVVVHAAWACPATYAYSLDNLRATAAVGLEAAYILYPFFAREMSKTPGGGSIISVASMNGIQAFPENPAYTSIKAALRLFTKVIARDFGQYGVRANNLCPGYVHTKMTAQSYADPQKNEQRKSMTMLNRWGTPADMVGPCLFLASEASSYVTGIDLLVDGGWTAKGM